MTTSTIRVLCVDDHRVVREGLASMVGRQPDMEVVAAAATGEESVELFRIST
jgi:DNA-binding NarL/FixJ family response regulator